VAQQAPAFAVLPGREQDAGVSSIAVNDIQLYYESHGSGALLVLLGGLGLDLSEMGMLTGPRQRGSGDRGRQPRHGPLGQAPRPYSIEQMAADVAGLMDRLHLPRAPGRDLAGRADRHGLGTGLARTGGPACADRYQPRAAGRRGLVRAGMMVADPPMLRGHHRQPRHAMRAQFDATNRPSCDARRHLAALRHVAHLHAARALAAVRPCG
jgi:hypothetical protein